MSRPWRLKMTETTTPKRRRMQFRLRTVFVVILLCSLPLSWLGLGMSRIRRHRAVLSASNLRTFSEAQT